MTDNFVQSISTTNIRNSTAEFAQSCLTELLESPATADLYGFAICTVSDAVSVYWSANTQSNLEQQVSASVAALEGQPDAPSSEQLNDLFRFEPADWPISDQFGDSPVTADCSAVNHAIDEFWTQFESGPVTDDNIIEYSEQATTCVLDALGDGLAEAVQAIDRQSVGNRENVTVLVWVNDPGDSDRAAVRRIAANLNPETLYQEFARTYFSGE